MKKISVAVFLVLLLALLPAGCGQGTDTPGGDETGNDEVESYSVGIVQIAEHPALDASREGFLAGLAEAGYVEGENLNVSYHSAQGDQSIALTIAQNLVNDQVDLILGIATPAAQAAATAAAGRIPVLFTATTDPVVAELVNDWDVPGVNVTGTSDLNPVEDQLELIRKIRPAVETIGVIYNAGEPNSVVQVEIVRAKVEQMGLALQEATVTNTSEVLQAAQSLVGNVQAIYVPTDNTAVQAIASILQVAEENSILVVAGEGDSVQSGAVATVGINYYSLGQETGKMAAQILEGADPATMAVVKGMDLGVSYTVNLAAAARMGVEIPEDILAEAEVIEE